MIVATTLRLQLRQFTAEDVEQLAPILADREVMRFSISGPKTIEQTAQFVQWCLRDYEQQGFGIWAVIHRSHNQLIGTCGLTVQHVDGVDDIEVGYRFASSYWGEGLATEAAQVSLAYTFHQLNIPRVIAIIEPENVASIRVAEKIGMQWIRNTSYHHIPVKLYMIQRPSKL